MIEEKTREFAEIFTAIREEVQKRVVGLDDVVEHAINALFLGGHVLLEGVPGLGKTLLVKTLAEALDLNFYISFSGIITFKNATQLHEVAKKVPLERMLIETDSPYLAPIPFRGKPNVPAYVCHVAESIATLRNTPLTTIAQSTTQNFYTLFQPLS